jgi:uncharacterized protein YcbK (DUF882 family)
MAGLLMAVALGLGSAGLEAARDEARTLAIYNIHTKETTSVLYKVAGRWVPGAKDKLDWAMRDWRRDEKTAMDADLYDLLWDMHRDLGSKEPIHLISGYRSRGTNEMLRGTSGGQARESRHILGKAADVHFPDVEVRQLRYAALVQERGGVGYYPTSALPFVHVDTDRVRAWPRLPRQELALLFPSGRTQHIPADGGALTPGDAREAKAGGGELVRQVAAFFDLRRQPKPAVAVADGASFPPSDRGRAPADAAAPRLALLEPPRAVDRPSRLTSPSTADRQSLTKLMTLAALTPPAEPRLLQAPAPARRPAVMPAPEAMPLAPPVVPRAEPLFVAAPAFDEEHPEELSYRPFPIAPLLTVSASADDPVLAVMAAPNITETLKLIDHAGSAPPLALRPPRTIAALMWTQQFSGQAVRASLTADDDPSVPSSIASRRVATQTR